MTSAETNGPTQEQRVPEQTTKRPYQQPELTCYGLASDLVQSLNPGNADGLGGSV
jgi:hypothetical protein